MPEYSYSSAFSSSRSKSLNTRFIRYTTTIMENIHVPMHPVTAHNGVWKIVICNLLTPNPATIQKTIIAMTAHRTDYASIAICRNFSFRFMTSSLIFWLVSTIPQFTQFRSDFSSLINYTQT